MRSVRLVVAVGLIAVLMAACARGPLTSTWVAPNMPPKEYRDLIVFGIAANPTVRRAYEDNFVDALKDTGVKARAAHTLLSDRDVRRSKAVQTAIERSGADGVIITYLAVENPDATKTETKTHVVPGLHSQLYPYYGRVLSDITAPDYYADYQALRLEADLYDAERATLSWSGQSDRLDPHSDQTMISEVIDAIINKLKEEGFLPK